jgi:hypothetical protein
MDGREKVGLRFGEEMSGYLTQRETDFEQREKAGKERNTPLSFEVTIHIEDVEDFIRLSGRQAWLTGTVSYPALGENLPIRDGNFGLFLPDPATAKRHMTYSFGFTGNDGKDYFLYGYKVIYDDPKFDLWGGSGAFLTKLNCCNKLYSTTFQRRNYASTRQTGGVVGKIPYPWRDRGFVISWFGKKEKSAVRAYRQSSPPFFKPPLSPGRFFRHP